MLTHRLRSVGDHEINKRGGDQRILLRMGRL